MGNWISETLDPESFAATPPMTPTLSLHQRFSLDPRSPSTLINRTPILVCDKPNPIVDPRSPTLDINRTPIYCSYHKENEVTTSQIHQPAAAIVPFLSMPSLSSPMVNKIEPLCFEGASEGDGDDDEDELSYLSVMSEYNNNNNNSISLDESDIGDSHWMTNKFDAQHGQSKDIEINSDSVSKLENQSDIVVKLAELENFGHSVSGVHIPLDKEVLEEIPEDKNKNKTQIEDLEKNVNAGDIDEDDVSDMFSTKVSIDNSDISSNITTTDMSTIAATTESGQKQQLVTSPVDTVDQGKEKCKISNIPLAVKKTKVEMERETKRGMMTMAGWSGSEKNWTNNKKATSMSHHHHYHPHYNNYSNKNSNNNNNHHTDTNNFNNKNKRTVAKAVVASGGVGLTEVRSPLQSRNCRNMATIVTTTTNNTTTTTTTTTTTRNWVRSSLVKMDALQQSGTTIIPGGGLIKPVSKPRDCGFQSGQVKSVHDKENFSSQ